MKNSRIKRIILKFMILLGEPGLKISIIEKVIGVIMAIDLLLILQTNVMKALLIL
jgi:hypothetical protein